MESSSKILSPRDGFRGLGGMSAVSVRSRRNVLIDCASSEWRGGKGAQIPWLARTGSLRIRDSRREEVSCTGTESCRGSESRIVRNSPCAQA